MISLRRIAFTALALSALLASAATELVRNPSFEKADASGTGPEGWPVGGPVRWEKDADGNHFARIVCERPGEMHNLYCEFPLPEGTRKVALSFRARVAGLQLGAEKWHDARIIAKTRDASGDHELEPVYFNGDTSGWTTREARYPIPEGTTLLVFMPTLFCAAAGTFDLDDIRLTALAEGEDVASAPDGSKEQKKTPAFPETEMNPITKFDTPVVKGNKLVTLDGRELWLQGVCCPSLDWLVDGDHLDESVVRAVEDWRANVIRLSLKSVHWFGRSPEPFNRRDDGGAGYRAHVDRIIDYANRNGCYILLDLHEYKAPTESHAEFWKSAASRYANRPGVMFDLLNEPHDISWREWRDGGTLSDGGAATAIAENNEAAEVQVSIGMQALVDAVRSTGAKNVVVCGGLDWAYDLSGVLDGYALKDPGGNGIVYSTHVYPWKRDWEGNFIKALEKVPVFMGEVGCQLEKMEFEKDLQDPYEWAPAILSCIQEHKIHWTAWSFHTGASPCVLSDWDNFSPTPFWGSFVRAALRGTEFRNENVW